MYVYTEAGTKLELKEPPLGSGGEGAVYEIQGHNLVAKIYHKPSDASKRQAKINSMIWIGREQKFCASGLSNKIAWPMGALYDSKKKFIGFGMQRISGGIELDELYAYPTKSYNGSVKDRVEVLINLCKLTEQVHSIGQVIGDFNPNNMKVQTDNTLTFVDSDSYHIQYNSQVYPCVVCASGYVAPEVVRASKGKTYADCPPNTTFTKYSDEFALAIHVFRMLMNGAHPYACKRHLQRAGSAPAVKPMERRVEAGDTPFFKIVPNYTTPSYAPNVNALPPYICALFRRAFIDAHTNPQCRPSATEWRQTLLRFQGELTSCKCDKTHYYWKGYHSCPYCEANVNSASSLKSVQPSPTKPVALVNNPVVPTAPAQPARAAAAATPTKVVAKNRTLFWCATMLIACCMQGYCAMELYPLVYTGCGEILLAIGVVGSALAGVGGTYCYNAYWASGNHTGYHAWWEYLLSIITSAAFSVAFGILLIIAVVALALAACVLLIIGGVCFIGAILSEL